MPKYRYTDVAAGQGMFIEINFKEQLLSGTFECMLNKIIGKEIDISIFDKKYKNDLTGASAIPPAVLLKLIIYGYSKGQISSRGIWELSKNNIVARALTGDMRIHWTSIADFISGNMEEFGEVFVKVLVYCNELGLIGGEMYAVDGLRLPSNASIENSGTKEQFEKRVQIYRKMAEKHLTRHLKRDEEGALDEEAKERFEKRQKHLNSRIEKITRFLSAMEPKIGSKGQELQSNVTDNESAMIHSSKGYVQGYVGIGVTDEKNQIIVNAEAFGTANEGEHLPNLLDDTIKNMNSIGIKPDEDKLPVVLCDANYSSEENLLACQERGMEAVIASGRENKPVNAEGKRRLEAEDFVYNEQEKKCICPHGKSLGYKGTTNLRGGEHEIYQASLTDCKCCPLFSQCTWSKKGQSEIIQGRKLLIQKGKKPGEPVAKLYSEMQEKMATEEYQAKYANRIRIVEPVFANIRYCKGLDRFTLRGKGKVNSQWQLYCIVHNLGKCLNGYNERKKSS